MFPRTKCYFRIWSILQLAIHHPRCSVAEILFWRWPNTHRWCTIATLQACNVGVTILKSAVSDIDKASLKEFFVSCFNKASPPPTFSLDALLVTPDDLSYFDIMSEEVEALLHQTKPHSTTGPDGIATWTLRTCAPELSPSIASMFNLSIKQSLLPAAWKLSTAGNDVQLFRPISLLPEISKPSKDTFSIYLQISYHQSINSAFAKVVLQRFHCSLPYMTGIHILTAVFKLDVCSSKDFDSVPHQAVLNKLHSLSIPPILIKWIANYLGVLSGLCWMENHQTGYRSNLAYPRDPSLAPSFFFFTPMICVKSSYHQKLYADDILLYKPLRRQLDVRVFQQDIVKIGNWIETNHLTINMLKTKFMWKICTPQLYLCGRATENVNHSKYLGIWISSNLMRSKHIDSIRCKARRLLDFISFSLHCSTEAILALYKRQVLPVLELGSPPT